MPKNFYFKFCPSDWLQEFDARSTVSLAAQGLWIKLLCLMHDGKPRGYLTDKSGAPLDVKRICTLLSLNESYYESYLKELESEGIFSRDGDFIFSRKMVRDSNISKQNSENIKKRWESRNTNGNTEYNYNYNSNFNYKEKEGGVGGEEEPPITALAQDLANSYVAVGGKVLPKRFSGKEFNLTVKAGRWIETALGLGVSAEEIKSALAYVERESPPFWVKDFSDGERLFTRRMGDRIVIQKIADEAETAPIRLGDRTKGRSLVDDSATIERNAVIVEI